MRKLACPWFTMALSWISATESISWWKIWSSSMKSVDAIAPVHQAQIISYLKLSGRSLGLLINFNVAHLKTASNDS